VEDDGTIKRQTWNEMTLKRGVYRITKAMMTRRVLFGVVLLLLPVRVDGQNAQTR
jgi:hypothetical protein